MLIFLPEKKESNKGLKNRKKEQGREKNSHI